MNIRMKMCKMLRMRMRRKGGWGVCMMIIAALILRLRCGIAALFVLLCFFAAAALLFYCCCITVLLDLFSAFSSFSTRISLVFSWEMSH